MESASQACARSSHVAHTGHVNPIARPLFLASRITALGPPNRAIRSTCQLALRRRARHLPKRPRTTPTHTCLSETDNVRCQLRAPLRAGVEAIAGERPDATPRELRRSRAS